MRLSNSILRPSRVLPSRFSTRRTFSTSPQWHAKTLPTFEESSTPELHNLLHLAREKIIPIAALNHHQQKYLFTPSNRTALEADPLHIEFNNNQSVQLGYTNPLTDLPGKYRLFNEATKLATTKSDWQNISKLLKGIAQGGRLQTHLQEGFIRKGIAAGQAAVVLNTVEAVESSKVCLNEGYTLLYLLQGLRQHAFWSSGDPKEETSWLVGAYTRVMMMMEHPKHCGAKRIIPGDLRREPWALAPLVEVLGLRLKNGWDSPEKSTFGLYVPRLMDMLNADAVEKATTLPELDWSIPKHKAVAKHVLHRWEMLHSALTLVQDLQTDAALLKSVPVPRILEILSTNLDNILAAYKSSAEIQEIEAPAAWVNPDMVRWSRYTRHAPVVRKIKPGADTAFDASAAVPASSSKAVEGAKAAKKRHVVETPELAAAKAGIKLERKEKGKKGKGRRQL